MKVWNMCKITASQVDWRVCRIRIVAQGKRRNSSLACESGCLHTRRTGLFYLLAQSLGERGPHYCKCDRLHLVNGRFDSDSDVQSIHISLPAARRLLFWVPWENGTTLGQKAVRNHTDSEKIKDKEKTRAGIRWIPRSVGSHARSWRSPQASAAWCCGDSAALAQWARLVIDDADSLLIVAGFLVAACCCCLATPAPMPSDFMLDNSKAIIKDKCGLQPVATLEYSAAASILWANIANSAWQCLMFLGGPEA